MDKKRLENTIHSAIFNKNVKGIKEVKDFYKHATADINISGLRTDFVNEQLEVFDWILDHPDYDYNSLFDGHFGQFYTNEELFLYFKVYHEKLNFIIDRYSEANPLFEQIYN